MLQFLQLRDQICLFERERSEWTQTKSEFEEQLNVFYLTQGFATLNEGFDYERTKLECQIDELKNENVELGHVLDQTKSANEQDLIKIAQLTSLLNTKDVLLKDDSQACQDLEDKISSLGKKQQAADGKINSLQDEIEQLQGEKSDAESHIQEQNVQLKRLKRELQNRQDQFSLLQERLDAGDSSDSRQKALAVLIVYAGSSHFQPNTLCQSARFDSWARRQE